MAIIPDGGIAIEEEPSEHQNDLYVDDSVFGDQYAFSNHVILALYTS